ncbi:MAG: citrate lyase acyl carrier protein [Tissierellia bacterium]|nr:citrate lyase acyl carrier protein [Tissierellia bacterium]
MEEQIKQGTYEIKQRARAGSYESNDLLVEVVPDTTLVILIKSVVDDLYHDAIKEQVEKTLSQLSITKGKILIDDRGALDYAIRARVRAAIERSSK